jgi:hypothetical protein
MVFPKGNEWPPIIAPSIIAKKRIKHIKEINLEEYWSKNIQIYQEVPLNSLFARLQEIIVINATSLKEGDPLIAIPEVRSKIEMLTEFVKLTSQTELKAEVQPEPQAEDTQVK